MIILLALTPGVEARGAYPLAFLLGYVDPYIHLIIYMFSTIPSIPIIYGLKWFEENVFPKTSFLEKLYISTVNRVRRKATQVTKYKIIYVGLTLYVAIPFPLTGVWTGSLIAYLLGLDRVKSILSIAIGNMITCTVLYLLIYVLHTTLY